MKTLTITGCGTLGMELVKFAITKFKLRVIDNSEIALTRCKDIYGDKNIRYILADVRDKESIKRAIWGSDYVIHTAAYKHVELGEYNPHQFVDVNLNGLSNVATACIRGGVKSAIFISSDKSVEPSNLYGMTKTIGEYYWKHHGLTQDVTNFSIFRPGNFFGSSGSVIDRWDECIKDQRPLIVTDLDMVRYYVCMENVVDILLNTIKTELNRVTIIPIATPLSLREIYDTAYDPYEYKIIGARQGEKQIEKLIKDNEVWYPSKIGEHSVRLIKWLK